MCDVGKKLLPPLKEKQQLSVKLTHKERNLVIMCKMTIE